MLASQRGSTFAETIVSAGIIALVLGVALTVAVAAAHRLTPNARADALERLTHRELAVARDLLKYDGAILVPATIATTVPLAGGTPLPVTLVLRVGSAPGATTITIEANDGAEGASESATITAHAPLPGSTIAPEQLVPAPTGAP